MGALGGTLQRIGLAETFNFSGGGGVGGPFSVGNTITSGTKSGIITQVVDNGAIGAISLRLSGLPFAVGDSISNGSKSAAVASIIFYTPAEVFRWRDDLSYVRAKDYKGTPPNGDRPVLLYVQADGSIGTTQTATTASNGEFSWFLTVSPSNSPQGLYAVSVVVCDARALSTSGEAATTSVSFPSGATGYGGVNISISSVWPGNWTLKTNDWILLCSVDHTNANNIIQATWYRIANIGYDTASTNITLVGPDWYGGDGSTNPVTAVSINRVTGVYATTMQLDTDAAWTK